MSQHSALALASISKALSECPQETIPSQPNQPRLLPLFPIEVSPPPSQSPQETISSAQPLLPLFRSVEQPPYKCSQQTPEPPMLVPPPMPQIRTDPFCGSMSVIGKRPNMEDAIAVVPNLYLSFMQFYGVFDGYMGNLVSSLCHTYMHEMVRKELGTPPHEVPRMSTEWWGKIMMRSFRNMDRLVLMTCPCGVLGANCGGPHSIPPTHLELVGSTAAVVVLSEYQIVVANCGHSGVVLSHNGNPIPLTMAHKPDRPDERARIQLGGAPITRSEEGARFRVEHLFPMTRAIGFRGLKRYLIPDPEVALRTRDAKDEFLIIASDGLWDAVSPSMACNVARTCLGDSRPPFYANANDPYGKPHSFINSAPSTSSMYPSPSATAAATLTRLAGARGSVDNISVIVVDLMNKSRSNS